MTDHFLCYLTAVCLAVALAVAGAEVLDHLQARDAAHADCRAELDAERAVSDLCMSVVDDCREVLLEQACACFQPEPIKVSR